MKKTILVLGVLAGLFSCTKDEDLPEPIEMNCSCGTIISDDVEVSGELIEYSVRVRNNCTQNKRTFFLSESRWMSAFVGSDICFNKEW